MSLSGAVLPGQSSSAEPGRSVLPLLCLVVCCGGYALGAALGWGSRTFALVMGDFGLSAAALAAAVSCLCYARRRSRRLRPAWLLFAVSSAMAGAGNAVWGWYEVVLGEPVPAPSSADFFFLLFAPPAIVGLLVLAKRPDSRAGWVCLGLDSWLIGGSLLTLSWSLALAHTAHGENDSVARAALALAYPLLDIALVSMVLALHFRRSSANRSAINTAIAALALTVLCDALFTSPLFHDGYRSGQLLDAGWFAGSVLLAYAPWVGRRDTGDWERAERRSGRAAAAPGSLAALTPYLAAGVCTLGILYNVLDGRHVDRIVITTSCTVVLALVVRQGIMLVDNIRLTQELAHKENHFRSLVQGSSDVIMIAAPSGVLRYVSPAAAGVYGVEAEELVGSPLADLIHPDDLGGVVHEVRRFLAAPPEKESTTRIECRFRAGDKHRSGGGWLNVESTVNRHHGGLIFNSRDVTERVRLQAQLRHSAEHDPLTDLPNRALFTERVRLALSGRRSGDPGTAVLFVDLDGFKAVNDTIGHQAGDELLVHAARRLRESVRAGDTAARLGGDEFAALILGDGGQDETSREYRILEIADRLRSALSQPYRVSGAEARVAASIGVAFAEPGIGPAELMRNADLAMYRAKAAGKDRVELYTPQMQADVVHRVEVAGRLRAALEDGEFTLLHQPVVALASGRIAAVSAQARWRSAQGILFTPAEVLRASQQGRGRSARTAQLGGWLLEAAVRHAAERHRDGLQAPVGVRLAARRLVEHSTAPRAVEGLLTRYDLPPAALVLELSDLDPQLPPEQLEHRLAELRGLGVRVALDGFGGGTAGMRALCRLPVDFLRLHRSLVEEVVESERLQKITGGLLRVAAELGVESVADGLELPEQVVALRSMGCTYGQGMAFAGPLDDQRLRGVLTRAALPVPGAGAAVLSGGGVLASRAPEGGDGSLRPVPEGDERPLRPSGVSAAETAAMPQPRSPGESAVEPAGHSPSRSQSSSCSNNETRVPPT
ncbi:putative bifunctional diguanylate cyclase/phosphodiesterase [Streptomyces sp. TP-A0874]|uniref:putative bifunctional diguanylate cyclase/phosphodiesterase n=1 Tax=Streptomyces sp. TP-A0874 TaxID=549819 RepID=UPI000852A0D0|nr:EAL domain-containing protein [Streptomyces sp. TP-A0874]